MLIKQTFIKKVKISWRGCKKVQKKKKFGITDVPIFRPTRITPPPKTYIIYIGEHYSSRYLTIIGGEGRIGTILRIGGGGGNIRLSGGGCCCCGRTNGGRIGTRGGIIGALRAKIGFSWLIAPYIFYLLKKRSYCMICSPQKNLLVYFPLSLCLYNPMPLTLK